MAPGYYVVSRNGSPISGPYATMSKAAPFMIAERGASVMFVGPGDSADWAATKPVSFPYRLSTPSMALVIPQPMSTTVVDLVPTILASTSTTLIQTMSQYLIA